MMKATRWWQALGDGRLQVAAGSRWRQALSSGRLQVVAGSRWQQALEEHILWGAVTFDQQSKKTTLTYNFEDSNQCNNNKDQLDW